MFRDSPRGAKRMRLEGGGRKVMHQDLDAELADWVREMREKKRPVSRRIIVLKATEIFRETVIKVYYKFKLSA